MELSHNPDVPRPMQDVEDCLAKAIPYGGSVRTKSMLFDFIFRSSGKQSARMRFIGCLHIGDIQVEPALRVVTEQYEAGRGTARREEYK